MALTQEVSLAIKKSFEYAHWDMKIYWISPETPRNSTTVITLMLDLKSKALKTFEIWVCTNSEFIGLQTNSGQSLIENGFNLNQ